jgi:hypothetical protein
MPEPVEGASASTWYKSPVLGPPRWKLLESKVVEDHRRGMVEVGVFELRCRACGAPFLIRAIVHGRGEVPSRTLSERRNCRLHKYSHRRFTPEEFAAGLDLV